jgi:hypothetical protein
MLVVLRRVSTFGTTVSFHFNSTDQIIAKVNAISDERIKDMLNMAIKTPALIQRSARMIVV